MLANRAVNVTPTMTTVSRTSISVSPGSRRVRLWAMRLAREAPPNGKWLRRSTGRGSAPQEHDPKSPREGGYRVPRCVADLVAARPVHLAMIDGIESQTGGEGINRNTRHVTPHVLVAGTNTVCVDAVGAAVMGFDPMADRGTAPFETCDNTLRLAEQLGVGTRDLKRIEVIGARIGDVVFDYRKAGVPRTFPARDRSTPPRA